MKVRYLVGASMVGMGLMGMSSIAKDQPTHPITLKMVIMVTRHGLRTPISAWNTSTPETWNCTPHNRRVTVGIYPEGWGELDFPVGEQSLAGSCYLGQLLLSGHLQCFDLGNQLRSYYVEQLGLIHPTFTPAQFYLRSTCIDRTLESLQSILRGIFPCEHALQYVTHVKESKVENMFPRGSLCPRLKHLLKDIRLQAPYTDRESERAALIDELEPILGRSISSLSGTWNSIDTRLQEGMELPEGLTEDRIARVRVESNYSMRYKHDHPEIIRLGIGTFLGDIRGQLEAKIHGNDLACVIYSGHDNTLNPLLLALGIHDGAHPPMASHLIIELYEDAAHNHHIRLAYNHQHLALPYPSKRYLINGKVTRDLTLIPYPEFVQQLQVHIPDDFDKECLL